MQKKGTPKKLGKKSEKVSDFFSEKLNRQKNEFFSFKKPY